MTDAPPQLCRVIESLLEPDREKRPASAAKLVELLDEVAPPPRVRRELGVIVTQTPAAETERVDSGVKRTGSSAAKVEELGVAEAATLPARPEPEPAEPAAVPVGPPATRSSRRDLVKKAGVALLAVGGLTAGAFALWPDRARDLAKEPDPLPEPESEREARAEPDDAKQVTILDAGQVEGPETTDATGRQTSDAPPPRKATPPPKAHLTVAVFPWGEVWINGKHGGTAPLKDQALKPGVYKISAGQGRPARTQTVRLRAGERKTVVFDLTRPKE